tara:strand:+ start:430 stop:552 length:123 start_codon:yes stop_codon:yes gene_type:complete
MKYPSDPDEYEKMFRIGFFIIVTYFVIIVLPNILTGLFYR